MKKNVFVLCLAALVATILSACGPQVKLDISNPSGQVVFDGKVANAQKISVAKGAAGVMILKGAKMSDVQVVATALLNAQKGGLEVGLAFGGIGAFSLLTIALWPVFFDTGEEMAIGPFEESTTVIVGDEFSFELVVTDGGEGEGEPETALVPDLTGLTRAQAVSTIEATCLVVGTVTEVNSATIPAGVVVSWSPTGTQTCGTAINFVVSKGPEPVETATVPDLTGLNRTQAESAISATCLTVGTVTEVNSATIPAGVVVSWSPTGTQTCGTAINFVISLGPEPLDTTTVPSVVGMTQTAATSALAAASLVVGAVTEAYSATVPVGSVLNSSPAGGTIVPKGSSVALVVSKGPEDLPVLGVTLITPPDGAVITAGSNVTITAHITGPNPVDVVVVNPDGKKVLLVKGLEIEDLLTVSKAALPKGVFRVLGVTPPYDLSVPMDFLYAGKGGVTVQVTDTVTHGALTVSHTVTIQ